MQAIQKETNRGWIERISGSSTGAAPSVQTYNADESAYYQERAKSWHEDTERRGLEALVNGDKDILNTVNCINLASKSENLGLTYAILDVDRMSKINAKYGKNVGDLILRHVRKAANEYLMKNDKAYHVGKPSTETPESKGDQLILILNHAHIPQDDLDNLIGVIKEKVATRVYDELQLKFPSMPASWNGLEKEKISVSIGYATVRNARIYNEKRGEEKCTMVTLLRDVATNNLKVAKKQTKKTTIDIC